MRKDWIDISYQKFGKITALKKIGKPESWECVCDCGTKKIITSSNLRSGRTISCGCHKPDNTTHGLSHSEEYRIWAGIKKRCLNKNSAKFPIYGGRGIIICDRWKDSFENFHQDMGKRPSKNHSIERIDNNGSYEPMNCKWATRIEQSKNKRNNVFIYFNGKTQILPDWAKEFKVQLRTTHYYRIKNNWGLLKTLQTPIESA